MMGLLNTLPLEEKLLTTEDHVSSSDEILALANLLDDERPTERLSRAVEMLEHLTIDGLLAFPWAASLQNQRLSAREIERLHAVQKLLKRTPPAAIGHPSEILSCHSKLVKYLKETIGPLRNECMVVFYLNTKLNLLHEEIITNHRPNHIAINPKQLVRTAILLGASRLIVAHNHPSGDTTPSQADLCFSLELKRLANDQDISLVSSLVIGRDQVTAIDI